MCIRDRCSEMEELFTTSFKQINTHFQQIFKELFGGGHARLYLSDESNVLESGIETVSYTHLDVYKRQPVTWLCVSR